MNVSPSAARIAAGSISARSGSGRAPRRSFQWANRSRLAECFMLRPFATVSCAPGLSPIGTRMPPGEHGAADAARAVPGFGGEAGKGGKPGVSVKRALPLARPAAPARVARVVWCRALDGGGGGVGPEIGRANVGSPVKLL